MKALIDLFHCAFKIQQAQPVLLIRETYMAESQVSWESLSVTSLVEKAKQSVDPAKDQTQSIQASTSSETKQYDDVPQ